MNDDYSDVIYMDNIRWGMLIREALHPIFTRIYSKYVLFRPGVIEAHLVISGTDILLLLLKATTNNSAPFSPTRLQVERSVLQ
jgi:hypothetical protein